MMNTNTFKIILRQSTGSLERILRLIRHRGFEVNYCLAREEALENGMSVTLQLTSERSAENLYHQLHKLVDVVEVHQQAHSKLRSCLGNE
ncbi:acetolactate synthase 2 small subunit [Kangiella shandongensis]|uniref:acetolactate synthase 2 small subunit n=1 Tax=Kangiella shandongensis TaxID=2763258 RepID=UPI001CC1537F|nr:acetolactate synthase 2 small subunit [Kangiella shandongensis]